MKKNYYVRDILSVIVLRIKLLMSNKKLIMLYGFFIVLSAVLMLTFSKAAEDKSSIPIGMVDYDKTSVTKRLIKEIDKSDTVRIIQGDKEELLEMLKNNEIYSLFIYEKGFTERLYERKTNDLVKHIYPTNLSLSKVVSDVVLSPMLDDVCYIYCKSQYESNKDKYKRVYTKEEYEDCITKLYTESKQTMVFDFKVNSLVAGKKESKNLDTRLLYREVVIALTATIILMVTMIMGNIFIDDVRYGTKWHMAISDMKASSLVIGDYISSVIMSFVFTVFTLVCMLPEIQIVKNNQILKMLLLMTAFVCTISMVFMLLARLLEDFVAYQLVGSIAILVISIIGALYILGFIISDSIGTVAAYTPMGLLLNGYKNIVLDASIIKNIVIYIIENVVMYCIVYIIVFKKTLKRT